MKLAALKTTHDDYVPSLWRKIDDLYEGGFAILDNARQYLPQMVNEHAERYRERIANASYVPYLGMIADAYIADLFYDGLIVSPAGDDGAPLPVDQVDPFWADFATNADLRGRTFSTVMRHAMLDAILYRRALVAVDFPRADVQPVSRAEEDAAKLARAYTFDVDVCDVIDWQYETRVVRQMSANESVQWTIGQFRWCVIRREVSERMSPDAPRERVHEFTVWRMVEGRAAFERFRVAVDKDGRYVDEKGHILDDSFDVQPFEAGVTTFNAIPLIELELPCGLWLGNKVGPLALEHFRRRSALNAAEQRTLVPTPVAFLGPEIGAVGGEMPSTVQQNPGRAMALPERMQAQGYLALGEKDRLEFPAIPTSGMELSSRRLSELVDEMFRISHMMSASISSTSTAAGRSGASKAEDRDATNTVLSAYSEMAKDLAIRVYDLITIARAEKERWTASGLDSYEEIDRAQVLEEAGAVNMIGIPSRTFKVEYMTRLALALASGLKPEQQKKIKEEINDGVTDDMVSLENAAAMNAANGKAPPPADSSGALPDSGPESEEA